MKYRGGKKKGERGGLVVQPRTGREKSGKERRNSIGALHVEETLFSRLRPWVAKKGEDVRSTGHNTLRATPHS